MVLLAAGVLYFDIFSLLAGIAFGWFAAFTGGGVYFWQTRRRLDRLVEDGDVCQECADAVCGLEPAEHNAIDAEPSWNRLQMRLPLE